MPFQIIRHDITKVAADAIVNTANPEPIAGSGTDGAIYQAAGKDLLLAERKKIGFISPGETAVTPAFNLHAKYIIHTVGPIWEGGNNYELETLASCYRKSLLIAGQLKCESIAFPLISTGVYGFPKDKALDIAINEIGRFLETSEMDVKLVVFDRTSYRLSEELMADVRSYISDNISFAEAEKAYAAPMSAYSNASRIDRDRRARKKHSFFRRDNKESVLSDEAPLARPEAVSHLPCDEEEREEFAGFSAPQFSSQDLDQIVRGHAPTFQEHLLSLIDKSGMSDAEVYKKANIDRKHFSKIRCNPDYKPKKSTALALAIALGLNLEQTKDFLSRAGLALSPSSPFDLIIEYCISHQIYDIFRINSILFEYDQQMLGV